MPYYCTVPRCTSMAGKAKNVSFHQFPRDEELAKLWNRILKRGKPYTKYSKVCSLHFKPEDYTITSVGKNKGQWRTLRKDAIPSQNLPSESPTPYTRRSPPCWMPTQPSLDPMVQQQMAQAIYMQTMLAMQSAAASESHASSEQPLQMPELTKPSPSGSSLSEIELLLRSETDAPKDVTYKCQECSKCFKDPDVFLLHKRTHKNTSNIEKENYSANIQDREETLRANPILANLLKTTMRLEPESSISNILTVENQIMTALASNMEAYIRTLTSMLSNQGNNTDTDKCEEKSESDYETNEGEDSVAKDGCVDNEIAMDEDINETKGETSNDLSGEVACDSPNDTNENENHAKSIDECPTNTQDVGKPVLEKHSNDCGSVNENNKSNDSEKVNHENDDVDTTDKDEQNAHETENHQTDNSDSVTKDNPSDDKTDAIDENSDDEMIDDKDNNPSDGRTDAIDENSDDHESENHHTDNSDSVTKDNPSDDKTDAIDENSDDEMIDDNDNNPSDDRTDAIDENSDDEMMDDHRPSDEKFEDTSKDVVSNELSELVNPDCDSTVENVALNC